MTNNLTINSTIYIFFQRVVELHYDKCHDLKYATIYMQNRPWQMNGEDAPALYENKRRNIVAPLNGVKRWQNVV